MPSSLSAFLGITEPAIFGVNIRYRTPFIAGCCGGAIGGMLASWFGIKATAYGITGLVRFPDHDGFLGTVCDRYAGFLCGCIYAVSFVTYKDPDNLMAPKRLSKQRPAPEAKAEADPCRGC
jgi:PTS system sucrose-specific IIC component